MYLVDTNVFLEILLKQDKREICKEFLDKNIENLNLTDFSLHSIGVILFRYDKADVFQEYIEDVISNFKLLSFPVNQYRDIVNLSKSCNLDFDDAYQYSTAKYYRFRLSS